MPEAEYWGMMEKVCGLIHQSTSEGGALYFMQREKNVHHVMRVLESSGWTFQNLIIWRKKPLQFLVKQDLGSITR